MPGLIEKAVVSGSDNPERYLKRIDRNKWVKGGYCIQATPFELAQAISAIRSHSAPKSMLCVGVGSGGTERFMAEELGIMSIRFTEESEHPAFEKNCEALQACGVKKAEIKKFDLVTVFGEVAMAGFEAAKTFIREGTVVAVFETGSDAMQPQCRLLWHGQRKAQTVILHTHEQGVGVFICKNMTAMGVKDAVESREESIPAQGTASEKVSSEAIGDEGSESKGFEDRSRQVEPSVPSDSDVRVPAKRRGRPPKVKA